MNKDISNNLVLSAASGGLLYLTKKVTDSIYEYDKALAKKVFTLNMIAVNEYGDRALNAVTSIYNMAKGDNNVFLVLKQLRYTAKDPRAVVLATTYVNNMIR
jgi:hypothetical protein